ncbi:polyunsaturated fatty acid (12S)/(13S)-lipoxygenase, epidermal-type-like isoform X2 [Lynx canadensis]|uniref:polyunsaturated fatty acid (12S)/(13S)-lipoxygenase, epidermal-type-like isoform X2 n=1 Tax=Lynx canadensis TaxID=61383 RepID=UPI0011AFEF50|nr:polyunsaturated fatty acid (12S)/(13S)-lipoxygenase, epidermal-type-like isoform X2 [Lynx canadensis]
MREPWTPGAMSTDGSSLCLQVPFTEVSRVLHSKPHLSFVSPGFPVSLDSRAQLCRFVTVCIFTCTGQHASAHLGQPDGYCWVPNGPRTTRRPPPVSKDATEKDTVVSLLHAHRARGLGAS